MLRKSRVDGKSSQRWRPNQFICFKYVFFIFFSLEWSPVHKSAKFWRENALRLNEKNYDLLRILIHLLDTSKDPLVLSVASYDIGEYVRHNPRGKK